MRRNQELCTRAAECSYHRRGTIQMAAYWAKVAVVKEVLLTEQKCDYAIWLDADAVMHQRVPNASALLGTQDMLISKDLPQFDGGNGMFNAGSFLVRNGKLESKFSRGGFPTSTVRIGS